MDLLIKLAVALISLCSFFKLITMSPIRLNELRAVSGKIPLLLTGLIANVADTLGIGSFAIIIAFNNRFKFTDDKKIPGTLNAQAVLPCMLQSLLFLNVVDLDIGLLIGFVFAACFGGFLSGYLVARMDGQTIRGIMCVVFVAMGILILLNQLHLLPIGGDETSLEPGKYTVGLVAMFFAGMLPAIGAGLYVPIQVILFFLGLSPLVAFPIMTTAAVFAQSVALFPLIQSKEVALKESLYLALSGIAGVAISVPFITFVNPSTLRWLLLIIVSYNAFNAWQSYQRDKRPREDAIPADV